MQPLGFKILVAPLVAMSYFLADLADAVPETVRIWLDVAALAIFVAGILAVGRYKNALAATEITLNAMKEELAVYREKTDRLEQENRDLLVENTTLKSRPDLSALADGMTEARSEHRAIMDYLERLSVRLAG